jgi:hypothetical protein
MRNRGFCGQLIVGDFEEENKGYKAKNTTNIVPGGRGYGSKCTVKPLICIVYLIQFFLFGL